MFILIEVDNPLEDTDRVNDFCTIIDGIACWMFDNVMVVSNQETIREMVGEKMADKPKPRIVSQGNVVMSGSTRKAIEEAQAKQPKPFVDWDHNEK